MPNRRAVMQGTALRLRVVNDLRGDERTLLAGRRRRPIDVAGLAASQVAGVARRAMKSSVAFAHSSGCVAAT